jgi:hypothetical protein
MDSIEDEQERKKIAGELWEVVVNYASMTETIHTPFLLALKYGIEVAPRDFTRMVSNYSQNTESGSTSDFRLLGLFQAMSQYSNCPASVNQGAEWILLNGKDLKWNATSKKFETSLSSKKLLGHAKDIWGELYDPVGLMKTQSLDDGKILQCRTLAHDLPFRNNFLERVTPRFVREVTGDFTLEMTMAPQY